MILRGFFWGRAVVFSLLLIIGFGVFFYMTQLPKTIPEEVLELPSGEDAVPPVFTWTYEEDSELNLDGLPNTNIFLEARYSDGSVVRKPIDTVPGGCNALPDPEKDSLPNTPTIQCYSAGLGYRFMVTEGTGEYRIQRKKFEEASPDYEPPTYEYEVIARFPSAK